MIPAPVPEALRPNLLDPSIMVPPLLWLIAPDSDGITGRRIVAADWRTAQNGREAPEALKFAH
jgi:3-oxoacyl-[acyl-carrier protein] reductase